MVTFGFLQYSSWQTVNIEQEMVKRLHLKEDIIIARQSFTCFSLERAYSGAKLVVFKSTAER